MAYVSLFFDFVLIGLLAAGISYAIKLTRQLAEMRAGRAEMERFVLEFNATVMRAEAGIKGLKNASRSAGDDLEKLIERGQNLREELHFLIESADQIASRLSDKASCATRGAAQPGNAPQPAGKPAAASAEQTSAKAFSLDPSSASAAERELLRVLKKIG
jgi:hypothetical protein